MYSVRKVRFWNLFGIFEVIYILHTCGKKMARREHLHHWDNSLFRWTVIVCMGMMKNTMYLVYKEDFPVATFQTRKRDQAYAFSKLATLPEYEGQGIGTFCLQEIEAQGRKLQCEDVTCEVYDQNEKVVSFYQARGYSMVGMKDTLKYREWVMKKKL